MDSRLRIAFVIAALTSSAHVARARQPDDAGAASREARAEKLFRDATPLVGAGNYAEGCPMLEESQRLDPALGTQFNLAVCFALSGRLVAASRHFREVAEAAQAAGKTDRARAARERLATLDPRVPRLRITAREGVTVQVDGIALPSSAAKDDVPVDPGPHTLQATAPGKVRFFRSVTVVERDRVAVAVPELESAEPSRDTAPPSPPWHSQRWIGVGVGSAGVVGLAVGAVLGAMALSKRSDLEAACPAYPTCAPDKIAAAREIDDSGRGAALGSTLAIAGGAAAVALGATLFLTAPSSPASASVRVTPTAHGAILEGRW